MARNQQIGVTFLFLSLPVCFAVNSAPALAADPLQSDAASEVSGAPINIIPTLDFRSAAVKFIGTSESVCGDVDRRPEGFWREALFSRPRKHICTDTTLGLQSHFGIALEGLPAIDWDDPEDVKTVRDYVDACITSVGSITDPDGGYGPDRDESRTNILTHLLGNSEVARILDSVGDFGPLDSTSIGPAPDCAATVISDSSGARFLATAAHCVIEQKRTNLTNHTWTVVSTSEQYVFRSFSGEVFIIDARNTKDYIAGLQINYLSEDVALFEIPTEANLPAELGIPLVTSTPTPWTPIYIVGRNPYLQLLNEHDGVPEFEQPREYMSITFDPECVALGNQGAHLYHNCQTQGGLSGAPILVFRDHRAYVAGVHAFGKRNLNEMCGDKALPSDNYGIGLLDSR